MQPPDPPTVHRQPTRLGCIVGLGCIMLSIGLILSIAIYTHAAHPTHLSIMSKATATLAHTSSTPPPKITCTTPPQHKGDSTISITSSGLKRTMLIHLASSYGIRPQALIINYHGYNSTIEHFAHYSNMETEADKAGFVLVFPQGVDNPPSWNAGVGAQGPTGDANDIQFTRDMLNFLEQNYCVDTHRIYVTGYSLGGGMAYRVACSLSDRITALATVAGAFYPAPGGCQPARPIPVLEIHGQADQFAIYNGNPTLMTISVSIYLHFWLTHDGCSNSSRVIFQQQDVTGIEWGNCAPGVMIEHYKVSDGGHTWPGGGSSATLGYSTQVIDANVVIWNFFRQFSK